MGSFIGGLVTRKKTKKLNKAMTGESLEQTDLALETAGLEKEANEVMLMRANTQMQQERVSAVREARIRRGQIVASATNAGAAQGSIAELAAGAIMTQLNAGIGIQNIFSGYAGELSDINEQIGEKQSGIIRSQGEQAKISGELNKQQAKANLIGGAIDLGLTGLNMYTGGALPTGGAPTNTSNQAFHSASQMQHSATSSFNYMNNSTTFGKSK